jgi:hypothetical protein
MALSIIDRWIEFNLIWEIWVKKLSGGSIKLFERLFNCKDEAEWSTSSNSANPIKCYGLHFKNW